MCDERAIEKVIASMKELSRMKPVVYNGKGEFSQMTITFRSGISEVEIEKMVEKYGLELPVAYKKLLAFSNGIYFFEYADDKILSIQEALQMTLLGQDDQDTLIREKLLQIATCKEDSIYMKCDGSDRNIYVSEEGISPLRPLNMSFLAFLEAALISGFSYFWLWGTESFDLY